MAAHEVEAPAHHAQRLRDHVGGHRGGRASFPCTEGTACAGSPRSTRHDGTFVLVGRQGALCGNVKLVSGRFWASEHAVVCAVRSGHDARWIAYLLHSLNLNQYSVSAAQPGLAVERIATLQVAVPPGHQQRAIADFLDRRTAALDALIEKKECLLALAEERRHATICTLVTKGVEAVSRVRDSGHQWIGDIPAHWDVARMRHVARLESGHTPSRQHPEYWVPEECTIPWVSLADVWQIREGGIDEIRETAEKVSPLGVANSAARVLPAGTVIVSRTASVGFSAIISEPMATTQDFVNWILRAAAASQVPAVRLPLDAGRVSSPHDGLDAPNHLHARRCEVRDPCPAACGAGRHHRSHRTPAIVARHPERRRRGADWEAEGVPASPHHRRGDGAPPRRRPGGRVMARRALAGPREPPARLVCG